MTGQTEDGKRWVEEQLNLMAALDAAPRWGNDGPRFRVTVESGGKQTTLHLRREEIDDSQGGNNAATRAVCQRLQTKLREFLHQSFGPAKKRIGF
jgi:hypothetical protein